MKRKFIYFGLLMAISLFYNRNVISQNCKCIPASGPDRIIFISEADALKFSANFKSHYQNTPARTKTHSVSVDFSKKAFLDFYTKVFENQPGKYIGVNFNLASFGAGTDPGHVDPKQIGMFMSPVKCLNDTMREVDPNGYMIRNHSFNRDKSNYTRSNRIIPVFSNDAPKYMASYLDYFVVNQQGSALQYTKHVFIDKEALGFLYALFMSTIGGGYDAIRVFFATYDAQSGLICGQVDAQQLTIFIVPVANDGDPDYDILSPKSTLLPIDLKEKAEILKALNHGDLCPNKCK